MNLGHWRDLVLMALLELVGFTVSMLDSLKRSCGRRRDNHGDLARHGGASGRRLWRAWPSQTSLGNVLVAGPVLCEAGFVMPRKRLAPLIGRCDAFAVDWPTINLTPVVRNI